MAQLYREEPWGSWRDNAHAALISSTLANIFRRKGSNQIDWKDFMMKDREHDRRDKLGSFVSWMRSMAKPRGSR